MKRAAFFLALLLMLALAAELGSCVRDQPAGKVSPPVAASSSAGAATAPALLPEVESVTSSPAGVAIVRLDNGLTLIVSEDHNLPIVHVECAVHTGSMYEGKYLGSGISHLVEHLVAEGAESPLPGEQQVSSAIDKIGGQSNAFTNQDQTSYFITATASRADECIDLVAQWMANPQITQADFEREHGVVQRELEMGLSDPNRQLWYAHARNVYGDHPAGVPIIGYQPPLAKLTYQDVLDYHRRKYVPQNMIFCVAGDVSTASVIARVRRGFAGTTIGRQSESVLPEVTPVVKPRRVVLESPGVQDVFQMTAFLTIPLLHEDLYALDLLSDILTNGQTSRLNEELNRKAGLVTSITSSSFTPPWGRGQFVFSFRCEPGKADAAEAALLEQIRKVIDQPVSPEELARAKRQKTAEYVYSRQSVQSQAGMLLSDYLATQDVGFSKMYTDRIQKVTAQQVQAVARKYLQPEGMVVTRLMPAKSAATMAASQASATQPGQAAESFTLPNGLRVVLRPMANADLASAALTIRGGLLEETPQTNGLGGLMTALTVKGAGELSAEQIDQFFENAGGSITGQIGTNTFFWQATVLADSFPQALPILADVALRPTFPAKELEILRAPALARIKQNDETVMGQAYKLFRQDFFGSSPLALQSIGRAEVVQAAKVQDIATYHEKFLKAGSAVLAIYGRFDRAQTRAAVEKLFAAMPGGQNPLPDVPAPTVAPAGQTFIHQTNLKGAAVLVAAPGMKLTDMDDTIPMTVLDTVISGYHMPSGWLHNELRGKQLVYSVHAMNYPALVRGAFLAEAECEPAKVVEVANIIRRDFAKTTSYQFTQEDIDQAVNTILTSDLLDNQSVAGTALQAALDELYGFGYDFRARRYETLLRAVKGPDLTRVAGKYLGGGYSATILTPQPALAKPAANEKP
jgi:zinc protease